MKIRVKSRGLLALAFPLFISAGVYGAAQTLKYTYDELGRLTYVDDNVNGDRDFDYDESGNRTIVATKTTSDGQYDEDNPPPSEVQLTAPTGLNLAGPFSPYGGGYTGSWNAVSGATEYVVQDKDGKQKTTTKTYVDTAGSAFVWVYARNASGSGPKAYF